jgi:beta-N-acetylhexosaminidase
MMLWQIQEESYAKGDRRGGREPDGRWRRSSRWMNALGAVLLLVLILLSGCSSWASLGTVSATATATVTATATATSTPVATDTATATLIATSTPARSLGQRIDAYIARLTPQQQIGQTLMLAVYASGYTANLNQALTQWHIGSAIFFPEQNGGPLQPATLSGLKQLMSALKTHADTPLLLATDEEGGTVDRLAFYYGSTPSPQQLAATGDLHQAYLQAQTDAARMQQVGLNVDFAPLADIFQGGGIEQSRTFGTTSAQVTTYAGAFLDGLQQHGVAGTLKHWPGLGASTGNPDYILPTVNHTQAQLNAIDFASFRALLPKQPGMIMVTHVFVPAYDTHVIASLSPVLVQQVLRGHLGYQGVVVTDSMDAQGLIAYMQQQGYSDPSQGIAEACVRAFVAGDDLIEAPIEQDRLGAVVAAMTRAVQSGRISSARLHEALHRIVALKVRLGLLKV